MLIYRLINFRVVNTKSTLETSSSPQKNTHNQWIAPFPKKGHKFDRRQGAPFYDGTFPIEKYLAHKPNVFKRIRRIGIPLVPRPTRLSVNVVYSNMYHNFRTMELKISLFRKHRPEKKNGKLRFDGMPSHRKFFCCW